MALRFLKTFALALLASTALSGAAYAQGAPRPDFGATGGESGYYDQQPMPSYGASAYGSADAALMVGDGSAQRSAQQAQGNYMPLSRSLGIPLGTTQDAWGQPTKNKANGQIAPGVVRFYWSPELIMPIRIRDYMVTMIVLPEWESVSDVFIGESYYVQAAMVRPNVVAVRSGASGIDTSLTVVGTSGNLYTFYVRAESYNTKKITDINVFVDAPAPTPVADSGWLNGSSTRLALFAPGTRGAGVQTANLQGAAVEPLMAKGPANSGRPDLTSGRMIFNMKMYEVHEGDRVIAPELVYTDGVWTYFDFRDKAKVIDRPVVYRIVDGVETRVNVRTTGVAGEILVAEAVGDFVLRNGDKQICVIRIRDDSEVVSAIVGG
jgi:ComB9 competence protein